MDRRFVKPPCHPEYEQATKAKPGQIIRCTKCKKPFVEAVTG